MYLGEADNLQEDRSEKNVDKKSSFLPFALLFGGTLVMMFLLRNWFPEGRFND